MCVSGVRSGAVSCERVCVSCEWASRRSSVVRREAFSCVLRCAWDSEVVVSNFECEFLFRVCRRIFDSNFEFEFFVSLLYSTSRNWSSNSTSRSSLLYSTSRNRLSNSSALNFEFVLIYSTSRICRRNCCLRAEFLVWVRRRTSQLSLLVVWKAQFALLLSTDVLNYSRTIALASLSLPRELCARFSCVKY